MNTEPKWFSAEKLFDMWKDPRFETKYYPELDFKGDASEEIHSDHRIFSGEIINSGFRRADFVRVIYKLYSEQTELVGMDSTFIDGSKFVYKSGVISDTCLEPGSSVNFIVKVDADSSLVRYVTREVKWDVFE